MFFIFFNKLNKVLRVLNKLFIRSYYNFSTFFFRKHWQNIDKLLKISSRMNNFCFDLRIYSYIFFSLFIFNVELKIFPRLDYETKRRVIL